MNCQHARRLVSDRLDQPLPPEPARALAEHLASCPECARFARTIEARMRGIAALPDVPASPAVRRAVAAYVASDGDRPRGGLRHGLSVAAAVLTVALIAGAMTLALRGGGLPTVGTAPGAARPASPSPTATRAATPAVPLNPGDPPIYRDALDTLAAYLDTWVREGPGSAARYLAPDQRASTGDAQPRPRAAAIVSYKDVGQYVSDDRFELLVNISVDLGGAQPAPTDGGAWVDGVNPRYVVFERSAPGGPFRLMLSPAKVALGGAPAPKPTPAASATPTAPAAPGPTPAPLPSCATDDLTPTLTAEGATGSLVVNVFVTSRVDCRLSGMVTVGVADTGVATEVPGAVSAQTATGPVVTTAQVDLPYRGAVVSVVWSNWCGSREGLAIRATVLGQIAALTPDALPRCDDAGSPSTLRLLETTWQGVIQSTSPSARTIALPDAPIGTVAVDDSTTIADAAGNPLDFAALRPGDRIIVRGLPASDASPGILAHAIVVLR